MRIQKPGRSRPEPLQGPPSRWKTLSDFAFSSGAPTREALCYEMLTPGIGRVNCGPGSPAGTGGQEAEEFEGLEPEEAPEPFFELDLDDPPDRA